MSEGYNENYELGSNVGDQQPYTDASGLKGTGRIEFSTQRLAEAEAELQAGRYEVEQIKPRIIQQGYYGDGEPMPVDLKPEDYTKELETRQSTSSLADNPVLPGYLGRKLDKIAANLKNELGRIPMSSELDEEVNSVENPDSHLREYVNKHGASVVTGDLDKLPSSGEDPQDSIDLIESVNKAMKDADLTPKQRTIIEEYYLKEKPGTLQEVSAKLGGMNLETITKERNKALYKLSVSGRLAALRHPDSYVEPKAPQPKPRNKIFPNTENVPVFDPSDDRPYADRLKEFCQKDEDSWSRTQETYIDNVSSGWAKLEVIEGRRKVATERRDELLNMRKKLKNMSATPDRNGLAVVTARLTKVGAWLTKLDQKEFAIKSDPKNHGL